MRLDSRLVAVLVATAWDLATPVQAQSTTTGNSNANSNSNNTSHLAFFPNLLQPETTSARAYCPIACDAAGPTSFSWSRILSLEELERCDHTVIFEAMLRFPLSSPDRPTVLKGCTSQVTDPDEAPGTFGPLALSNADVVNTTASVQTGGSGRPASQRAVSDIFEAALKLKHQVALNPNNRLTAIFAKSGKSVVGLYAGTQVHRSTLATLMTDFVRRVNNQELGMPSRLVMQVCGPTGERSATAVFGVMADANGDLQSVHKALSGWAGGECVGGFDGSSISQGHTMALISAVPLTQESTTTPMASQTQTNSTMLLGRHRRYAGSMQHHRPLPQKRRRAGTCRAAKVDFGESCWSVAQEKCGISLQELYTFNGIDDSYCASMAAGDELCCSEGGDQMSITADDGECKYTVIEDKDRCGAIASRCNLSLAKLVEYNGGDQAAFCNNLKPKTAACCSSGKKPDFKPKPQANGDCAVHEVLKDDGCWAIADKYHLNQTELHKLNVGKTWGWAGCGSLLADQKICISEGRPPMPVQLQNVTCGPQVIGTDRPQDGINIADLNPCPLKVCCSGWGYCGLTDEFCTDTSIDNTPGTHKPNTNGCISNCGKIEITNNNTPPESFIRVGYFEAWNGNRPCLNMDVTEIGDPITHIHFSFGHISNDFVPSLDLEVTEQWVKFLKMSGPKKIISFGGWAFSNEPGTSHIMRQGVKPANRQKFADNIIKFVVDNKLDGVDFDWEYPGADDIEGSDPGTKEDGINYLKFLTTVRDGLPKEKSLAIAAPASYWYLRNFPIELMAKVLSYIVYMTYDLHGQWDAGGKWASAGCANGDCLRSHVNITETINSLAMITRAGVPSNKVIVGITSYGRSFKMADANCWGPSCLYLGSRNQSPAQPGKCTDTGGYIANGEIDDIIKKKASPIKELFDEGSDSDILIYNNVEYVAYMSQTTKDRRIAKYKGLNFGGATDWAVDLMGDTSPGTGKGDVVYIGTPVYTFPSMGCTAPCTIVLPPSTLPSKTVITISPYTTSLQVGTTTTTITIKVPNQTIDKVPFYNVPIPSDAGSSTVVQPYPSITLPPAGVPVTWVSEGTTVTTTRTIFLPPWPRYTEGPPGSWSDTASPSNIPTPTDDPIPDPPTPTVPFPTWTNWYKIPQQIEPITEPPQDNDDDDDDDDVFIIPCSTWFFSSCIKLGKFEIKGWKLRLPEGIIGPGPPPPPLVPWPTGWNWKGPRFPPWPKLKIGPGSKPEAIPEKPERCETKSASVCTTITSYGLEDKGTTTVTTTSREIETCATIYGCAVTDYNEATATDDISCSLGKRTADPLLGYATTATPGPSALQATETLSIESPEAALEARSAALFRLNQRANEDAEASWADDIRLANEWFCSRNDVIVFAKKVWDSDSDNAALTKRLLNLKAGQTSVGVVRAQSTMRELTAFWYLSNLPVALQAKLLQMKAVEVIYDPLDFRKRAWYPATGMDPIQARSVDVEDAEVDHEEPAVDHGLAKRATTQYTDWANSHISVPPFVDNWPTNTDFTVNPGATKDNSLHKFHYHDSAGGQQYIYIVESCVDTKHPEFIGVKVASALRTQNWGNGYSQDCYHGTAVSAMAVGTNLGVARKSILVPVHTGAALGSTSDPAERYLEALLLVLDDVLSTSIPKEGKAVISMSWGIGAGTVPAAFGRVMKTVLEELADEGTVLIAAAGNGRHKGARADKGFPQRVMGQGRLAESSLVVGATDGAGRLWSGSERFSDNKLNRIIHAPGDNLKAAVAGGAHTWGTGTSYAAPKVAGLVAYYRGLPSRWQDQLTVASSVKRLVQLFERELDIEDGPWNDQNPGAISPKFIWNAQVLDKSCLIDGQDLRYNGELVCPIIPDDLSTCPLVNRAAGSEASQFDRRACEPPPDGPGNGDNGDGSGSGSGGEIGDVPVPRPITWRPGPAQPTCERNCGVHCEGYYCSPRPTGSPPEFTEPSPPKETGGGGGGGGDGGGGGGGGGEDFPTSPPTFYLLDVTWVAETSENWFAQQTELGNWGNCDAMDKSADRLDGAEGDWPTYPWPENEFTGELCGKNLRYKRKDPGDYDVFDRDSGRQVGICTKAPVVDSKSCGIWIQATYNRVYECTGAC